MIACTDRRGVIVLRRVCPKGLLPLAQGRAGDLLEAIEGKARLAYDNETWLVPGVPEAANDDEAVAAAVAFATRMLTHPKLRAA